MVTQCFLGKNKFQLPGSLHDTKLWALTFHYKCCSESLDNHKERMQQIKQLQENTSIILFYHQNWLSTVHLKYFYFEKLNVQITI